MTMNTLLSITRPGSRKSLAVLPLIVLPFLTVVFWLLGGGQPRTRSPEAGADHGLNLRLPPPDLSGQVPLEALTKLRIYQRAARDSLRRKETRQGTSFFWPDDTPGTAFAGRGPDTGAPASAALHALSIQLRTLHAHLGEQARPRGPAERGGLLDLEPVGDRPQASGEPPPWTGGPDTADAEWQQLNGLLDKILEIQHPESVSAPASRREVGSLSRPVPLSGAVAPVTLLGPAVPDSTPRQGRKNGFFTLSGAGESEAAGAIEAAVYGTQTLVNGATVRLRLLQDVGIQGDRIAKNHLLFGTATLQGDRLHIHIDRVVDGAHLMAVHLIAYDLDGIPGLHIAGTLTRRSARNLAVNGSASLGQLTLDPSVGSRVAQAGIRAARGWIQRQARTERVTLRDGYRMWLSSTTPR